MTLYWIALGLAAAAYMLCVYGVVWSRRTERKREARRAKVATPVDEQIADLWWWAFRNQEYQAALRITAERARNTHPERVAEMFSRRVPDTSLLKEVV